MSIANSLLVALIVMSIVFIVLVLLSFLVGVQARILGSIKGDKSNKVKDIQVPDNTPNSEIVDISNGELNITGLDEETAAMVMAITCDALKIPLNELKFRSIRFLD